MAEAARRRGFSYGIDDLDYPAVSVHNPINAIGAKISGGKAFAFGRSVSAGVANLLSYYDAIMMSCPNTFWVLGGYSQGAMVVSHAVGGFMAAKVIYVGLFGDPETNLPEGKGLVPTACRGRSLSSYRVFVPECRTNSGSLGSRSPYVASGLEGKYGLWCNRMDYICGSTRLLLNNSGHTKYAEYNELLWMAEKVEKKLRKLQKPSPWADMDNAVTNRGMAATNHIQANLSSDEYDIFVDGTVTLDASQSFSFGRNIVEYQ